MNAHTVLFRLSLIAGLALASAAWAINTQLGEILPWLDCRQHARYSALASLAGLLLAFVAAILSWRATRRAQHTEPFTATAGFIGAMSALSALVFTFAIFLQGIASLVLSGCER
jgi:uncharacterized membrane protein YqjE